MNTTHIALVAGYTLIAVGVGGLFKISKNSIIINKRKFKKIEENIRKDERKTVYRSLGFIGLAEKEDN